ncbi:hypothetical protein EV361DRAFT_796461, partial [Lentinula raphanica]
IDDQDGDSATGIAPIYTSSNLWSQEASCTTCFFKPNPSRTFQGTWHDTMHRPTGPPATVQFNFTGTTLDVYCIISMLSSAFSFNYNLSFTLDDQPIPQTFMLFNNSSPVTLNSVQCQCNIAQQPRNSITCLHHNSSVHNQITHC